MVDFYADWCSPCRMMTPVVERLAVEYAGKVTIGKLDVDVNQDIAIRYGVMGIPTLGLFRDGKLVDRLVGYPGGAAPIKAWIEKNAGFSVGSTPVTRAPFVERRREKRPSPQPMSAMFLLVKSPSRSSTNGSRKRRDPSPVSP